MPSSTQLSKAVKAAWTTLCWGPLLTGVVQPRMLAAAAQLKYESACDVPAISQVRILSVSGCCAGA